MKEKITEGFLKGEIIRDGILFNSQTNQPAFKNESTNFNVVRQLRERGLVEQVKKQDEQK